MFNVFEKAPESLLDTIAQGIVIECILQCGITHQRAVIEQDFENTDTGPSKITVIK